MDSSSLVELCLQTQLNLLRRLILQQPVSTFVRRCLIVLLLHLSQGEGIFMKIVLDFVIQSEVAIYSPVKILSVPK